jgi:hypothetical protein
MMMIGLIDFPWTKIKRHPDRGRDDAAVRAFPVVRDIAPAGAGRYAIFRHADILVIDETANDALV